MSKKIISLDIDGVVVNYPCQMYDYAEKYIGFKPKSKSELIDALKEKRLAYEEFKIQYRKKYECIDSDKCEATITSDFWEFYGILSKEGKFDIVFRTTRPVKSYPNQLKNTNRWLNSLGIKCIAVVPKDEESFNKFNPILHVDDEISHLEAHLMYTLNDKLIHYNKNLNLLIKHSNFKEIKTLVDIWNIMKIY